MSVQVPKLKDHWLSSEKQDNACSAELFEEKTQRRHEKCLMWSQVDVGFTSGSITSPNAIITTSYTCSSASRDAIVMKTGYLPSASGQADPAWGHREVHGPRGGLQWDARPQPLVRLDQLRGAKVSSAGPELTAAPLGAPPLPLPAATGAGGIGSAGGSAGAAVKSSIFYWLVIFLVFPQPHHRLRALQPAPLAHGSPR